MMPSGVAGRFPSDIPQDLPAGVASSPGALEFVLLLERALGNGVAAQMSTGAVPEDLIDMNGALTGEEGPAVGQGSSSVSDEQHQAESDLDHATTGLLAVLNVLPLTTSTEPSAFSLQPTSFTPQQSANNSEPSVRSLQPSDPSLQPSAFRLPHTQTPYGVPPTPQLADGPLADLIPGALPIDLSVPIAQKIAPLPQSSPTVFPHRFELLEGNSVNAKPGLPEDGATSGSAPEGVRLSLTTAKPTPLIPLANNEPSAFSNPQSAIRNPQSAISGQHSVQGEEGVVSLRDNEPSAFSLQSSAAGNPQSAIRNPQSAIRGQHSVQGEEGVVSLRDNEPSAFSLQPLAFSPQHSAVSIATPTDPMARIGPELLDGEGFPERVQAERSDSDRTTIRLGSTRSETAHVTLRDGLASDPKNESRSFDHSSASHDDWRQFGRDRAIGPSPMGEEFRSESAVPPRHPGSLFDQVAEQLATAARLSLRNEGGRVQLRLHPQALGELTIEVSRQDSGIVASIKAQNSVAGDLLASDLSRLRTTLTEQGVPVSHLGVQVGMDFRHWSFEGNRFQPSSAIEYAPETVMRRDRESAVPPAPLMKSNSLIDIIV